MKTLFYIAGALFSLTAFSANAAYVVRTPVRVAPAATVVAPAARVVTPAATVVAPAATVVAPAARVVTPAATVVTPAATRQNVRAVGAPGTARGKNYRYTH